MLLKLLLQPGTMNSMSLLVQPTREALTDTGSATKPSATNTDRCVTTVCARAIGRLCEQKLTVSELETLDDIELDVECLCRQPGCRLLLLYRHAQCDFMRVENACINRMCTRPIRCLISGDVWLVGSTMQNEYHCVSLQSLRQHEQFRSLFTTSQSLSIGEADRIGPTPYDDDIEQPLIIGS